MPNQPTSLDMWINTAGSKPLLSVSETIELGRIIQDPESSQKKRTKAINKLVEHNLRLVVAFVKNWVRSKANLAWNSEETCDYLQLGAIGLKKAAEKYDPTRGYAFTTYAYNWIRQGVNRHYLGNRSVIRIPEHAMRGLLGEKVKGGKQTQNSKELIFCAKRALDCMSYDITYTENGDSIVNTIPDIKEHVIDKSNTVEYLMNLAKIDDDTKDILREYYVQGESMAKVANKKKITDAEIRKRLHRAQVMMRAAVRYNSQVPVTL